MRGLVPYAWRGLRARPARTILTAWGVALGVAVLVAGLAVNAGVEQAVDRAVAAQAGRADIRLTALAEAGVSGAALPALAALPEVAVVAPAIERRVPVLPTIERPALVDPVSVLGLDLAAEARVRDLVLVRGELPTSMTSAAGEAEARGTNDDAGTNAGPAGALIDEALATADGLDLGAELALVAPDGIARFEVVGILAGSAAVPGGAGRGVIVPIETAVRFAPESLDPGPLDPGPLESDALDAGSPGPGPTNTPTVLGARLTRIDLILADGLDPAAALPAVRGVLRGEPYVVTLPADLGATLRASTADLRATTGLLAAVALFAGAFLIANTLSMTVAERAREIALLRAAGASRAQVVRIVAVQAFLLGSLGSAAGVALGTALAVALAALFAARAVAGLGVPAFPPDVIAAAAAAGVLVTLLAAVEPARRAAALAPADALRGRPAEARVRPARLRWLVGILLVTATLGAVAFPAGPGLLGPSRTLVVHALLLTAVLVLPPFLAPLGRIAGLPFAAVLRLEERLGRAALVRDRGRSGLTLGSLVVGLAMIVALGVVAGNARLAATAWVREVVPGDDVLTAIAPVPLDERGPIIDLEGIDGVASASPIATFDLALDGARLDAAAVSGADLLADGRLAFVDGDRTTALAALDAGGSILLTPVRAEALGVRVGDAIEVPSVDGRIVELRVVGLVARSLPGGAGDAILVGWRDAATRFGVAGADAFAVRYAPDSGADARTAVAALAWELALSVAPVDRIEGAVSDAIGRLFDLFDLLALAALIVAALGIVNTLSMDVMERVREIGVLRAAGMSRRQVWRMVLVQAGILGIIGGIGGAVAGLGVGAVLVLAAGGGRFEVPFVVPWPTLLLALVMGVALAMLAAAGPARIAGRLPIARAVRAE